MYRFLLTAPFNVPCPVSYGAVGEKERKGGWRKMGRKKRLCLRLLKVCHQRMDTKRNIYVFVSHELKTTISE